MKLAGVLATAVLIAAIVASLFVQAMFGVPFVRVADHANDHSRSPSTHNSASLLQHKGVFIREKMTNNEMLNQLTDGPRAPRLGVRLL
jgi:hypothetical protein